MKDLKPKLKTTLEFRSDFDESELNELDFTPREKKKKLADITILKKKKNDRKSGTELF